MLSANISLTGGPPHFSINILNELTEERVFVNVTDDFRGLLFGRIGNDLHRLPLRLPMSSQNLRRYVTGSRSMPLNVFTTLVSLAGIDYALFDGKIQLRIGKGGTKVSIGPYLTIDEELAYAAELIRCDGHIPKNLQMIVFVNKEANLRTAVRNCFRHLGLPRASFGHEFVRGVGFLRIRSKLLAVLLSKIFEIPTGKKHDMRVPPFVSPSPELARALVRAAFDAEGTVQSRVGKVKPHPRRIVITNMAKSYLHGIGEILYNFGITTRIYREVTPERTIYRLTIYHQINLKRFLAEIQPRHRSRKMRLHAVLRSYRKNRLPERSLYGKVLAAIDQGFSTRRLIAHKLDISNIVAGNQVRRLRLKGLVAKPVMVNSNTGCYGVFSLTRKGNAVLGLTRNSRWNGEAYL